MNEYHQSALSSFEYCAYAYHLERIEGKRSLGSFATCRGTAVHAGREHNLSQKIESGVDCQVDEVLDATRDSVNSDIGKDRIDLAVEPLDGMSKRDAAGKIIDTAVKLAELDHEQLQPTVRPVGVEVPIVIEIPGYPFRVGMRLDSINADNTVSDLKHSCQRRDGLWLTDQYQPPLYALGFSAHTGRPFKQFVYDFVICTRGANRLYAYRREIMPTRQQTLAMLNRFSAMHESILKGCFPPSHKAAWKCSPVYCSQYRNCKYVF
ncbi:MAG: PD-(D/E)XK nuclease family protein [Gemmatimonadales bacterium]|nr:PD-(D/E)XK nuclease family protein [Gemmatimonadales bacterium]